MNIQYLILWFNEMNEKWHNNVIKHFQFSLSFHFNFVQLQIDMSFLHDFSWIRKLPDWLKVFWQPSHANGFSPETKQKIDYTSAVIRCQYWRRRRQWRWKVGRLFSFVTCMYAKMSFETIFLGKTSRTIFAWVWFLCGMNDSNVFLYNRQKERNNFIKMQIENKNDKTSVSIFTKYKP